MRKILLLVLVLFMSVTLYSQGKLDSTVVEVFYSDNTWQKSNSTNYKYDSNNNLIEEIDYNWIIGDENANRKQSGKTSYTYDSKNRIIEQLVESGDYESGQLESNRFKFTYDESTGYLIEMSTEGLEGSQWSYAAKIVFKYTNKRVSSMESYYYAGSMWVRIGEKTFEYNSKGLLKKTIDEFTMGTMTSRTRTTYTYDGNKVILEKEEKWDNDNNKWTEKERTENEWDSKGNPIKEKIFQNGKLDSESEYTYDTKELMSDYITPFQTQMNSGGFGSIFAGALQPKNKLLMVTETSYDPSDIYKKNRTTYYYSGGISYANNINIGNNVKLFPNPSSDFIHAKGLSKAENYIIYNALGRKMSNGIISVNGKIDIQSLTNGIYFLKLENKNSIKFIKK